MKLLKSTLRLLVLVTLLAAIVITVFATRDSWLPLFDPNAAGDKIDRLPPDDRMAREAVVQGVQAFYAFDSQAGKDTWLETLCQVTSQAGCKLTGLGANRLWEALGDQPFSYMAEVDILEKVSDRPATAANGKSSQVWKTVITLNQPLPGSETLTDTAYALVVTENGQWRFERFLTAPESAQFENEVGK